MLPRVLAWAGEGPSRGGDGVALRDANDAHTVDAPVAPILQRQREHAPLRVLERLHGNDAPDACAQAALPSTQAALLVTKLGTLALGKLAQAAQLVTKLGELATR